jgi:hypothetical protein
LANPTPLVRLELSGGRWLLLHLASVNQQLALSDMQPAQTDDEGKIRFRDWLAMLDDACEEKSWKGSVGDGLAIHELEMFVTRWLVATENMAFPLATDSDSETPSAEPLSEAQTADQSPSSTPSSSRSSTRRKAGASRRGK